MNVPPLSVPTAPILSGCSMAGGGTSPDFAAIHRFLVSGDWSLTGFSFKIVRRLANQASASCLSVAVGSRRED